MHSSSPEAWDSSNPKLSSGFLAAQSLGPHCIQVVAGDVNLGLKGEHCACRMASAAVLMSKAVMCQTLWEPAVHLPEILLCLEGVWRACLLNRVLPFSGFCFNFPNESNVFKGFLSSGG